MPVPAVSIIDIGLNPVLVHLGPLSIHWYGLMYVVGIVAGLQIMLPYVYRRGFNRDQVYAVFWPVVVACLVGGRLYYVVQSDFGWYLRHPDKIFATWEGGMAFYGAIGFGAIVAYIVCRRRRLDFPSALDCTAIMIPVAQGIGRIGNLINGDIVGYASSLPWATRYTNPANTFVPSHTIAYDPAALYELLFSVVLFTCIWFMRFRIRRAGDLFALWLGLYCIGQFALFFGRANIVVAFGLKQAQLTSIAIIVIGTPLWLLCRQRFSRPPSIVPTVERTEPLSHRETAEA